MPEVNRILVVKLSAFGDLLHAVPVANRLAEHFGCPVDWVTQPEYAELVHLHEKVDRVLSFPRRGAVRKFPAFMKDLRQERYDLAVDLQGLAKSGMVLGMARAVRKLSCPGSREGAHWFANEHPPSTGRPHALETLRDVLRYLEIDPDPVTYPMNWPAVPEPEGAHPRIGFAPRSRWPGKDWPLEKFVELGKRLTLEHGATMHIFGSAGDHEIGAELTRSIGGSVFDHCGRYPLPELGSALKQMDVMVCNDSGPMHLAAAVGTPLVALFGPTDPARTGPWGEGHQVLRPTVEGETYPDHRAYKQMDASFIAGIPVDEVAAAVVRALG